MYKRWLWTTLLIIPLLMASGVDSGIARRFVRLASGVACSASTAGYAYFDTDDNTAYVCNGTSYVSIMASASVLDNLSDVVITSVASGDVLAYNGTNWVNSVPGITKNAQTGTTYTVLTGDKGKLVTHSNGSAIAVTLPQSGAAGFPAAWFYYTCSIGAGLTTITPTTSTINGAATLALSQYQCALIISDGTNYTALTSGSSTDTGFAVNSFCNGVVGTANGGVYVLSPYNASGSNCNTGTTAVEIDVPATCTAKNLRVRASAGGAVAGSGVVALFVGGSASALTCTLGTGTSCSDVTHTVALTAGTSVYSVRVTTGQATDSTAGLRVTFQCQ